MLQRPANTYSGESWANAASAGNLPERLVIVTDAWHPQVNGVVRSIENTNRELAKLGVEVSMVTPERFNSIPCPTYPEIRLSIASYRRVAREIEKHNPSYVHIATEGPLGLTARRWCLRKRMPFSTSYHTRFPEYVSARLPIPQSWLYAFVRWFHNGGAGCMVATPSLARELSARGIKNLMPWTRGIDASQFHPMPLEDEPLGLPRPIFMTVGRVALEKNLPAFLDLDLPGSKVVVGDGPARAELEQRYPRVHFTGVKFGAELAKTYAQADVFVFPSLTDTFGNTILEALASGVPVAAYPVTGPLDIIGEDSEVGALDQDLRAACLAALSASREKARDLAMQYSWEAATLQFINNIRAANGVITPKWKKAWQFAKSLPRGRKPGETAGPVPSGD
ncbi:glycosyltransferase involved in cell wall biosynthesis [Rhizobium leguminosarum]|uniref:Glycosyltransferase involved in cell wall biosynthesis n=1 Tax=Rhizobium leguminosarum TaxID=384 RepID=A0AAE2SY14_RHILE|nr:MULTISPECIES: glycosyltransferase family 1 protein [Rhizobium]MBB4291089.1 glycosyltransferase involved in cell wall biosynthesis [Rhizobium leguminosarum]MBB4297815.1 glycosyltransferase involved in cell wall biosynthesis [Rhizobium leguminosarum]MBB4308954.1 glycosyltransferase involved in cell wall biosynthesis [Rhizobium leguminosarum]MBB4416790.1 glycosyltransferase involved in cell wall biosynthesis [Rhizobium leguminosarum]MBB4430241.1 glycosyltransferase involved in cell wall biosyn